jgi:hypothetical protein
MRLKGFPECRPASFPQSVQSSHASFPCKDDSDGRSAARTNRTEDRQARSSQSCDCPMSECVTRVTEEAGFHVDKWYNS